MKHAKNILQKAPGTKGANDRSIELRDIDPAIEGSWEVKLLSGEGVKISPVFEHLKSLLENYSPDAASNITKGPGAKVIEEIAREFAKAKSAMVFASWGANKNYHSDLANRAKALLLALCGHIGKAGSGFRSTVWWWPEESVRLAFPASLGKGRSIRVGSSALFYKYHCGLKEILGKDEWSDQSIKRPMEEYIQESLKKGWMRLYPLLDKTPKIWFAAGANALRRQRKLVLQNSTSPFMKRPGI